MAASRRLKAFRIDPIYIAEVLTGRSVPVPLPEGIEIVRYGHDWTTNSAIVIISHDSFEELKEGSEIPIETLMLRLLPK